MSLFSRLLTAFWISMIAINAVANITEYHLDIDRQTVNITGKPLQRITVNGSIPGPVLEFTEGDTAVIHVTNKMKVPSSVHWHGLLLPPAMDGVPGFSGYPSIAPGETFTYRFELRQNGTYWYHAHSRTQEQDGHYGALIVHPKNRSLIQADRDYVVVLSDFSEEASSQIMANLKKDPHYYNYSQRTLGDFLDDVRNRGLAEAWQWATEWGEMRMSPTDIADVSGYTFLINGRTPAQNWTGLFNPGETVRLRFINASAMSMYDVRIPGLTMDVVQADGQYVEPVTVDEFRFAVAETYDVLVRPTTDTAFTIAAEAIDRTGFAMGTLAPRSGMRGPEPESRSRALLTMGDMGMGHSEVQGADVTGKTAMTGHAGHGMAQQDNTVSASNGWADAGTPPGHKALSYADLRSLRQQTDTRPPEREIVVSLGGSMTRFIWTINGHKFGDEGFKPLQLRYGERVKLRFENTSMMAHPMHLHGMFVQLDNGQPAERLPNKHTVNVPPGKSYSVLLTADEPGEWAFHCHLLFHMAAGMMTKLVVAEYDVEVGEKATAISDPGPGSLSSGDHEVSQHGGKHHGH
jgi:FtsP/CotA-like multicopper oxidase with cupredoxin domain